MFEEDGRLYPGWLCEWCQTPANYAAFAYNAYWGDNPWAWGSILGIPFRVYNLDGEWVGIWFEKSGEGDDYSVDHGAAVLVIDPHGRFRALFSAPHKAENYVHDLPIIVSQQ